MLAFTRSRSWCQTQILKVSLAKSGRFEDQTECAQAPGCSESIIFVRVYITATLLGPNSRRLFSLKPRFSVRSFSCYRMYRARSRLDKSYSIRAPFCGYTTLNAPPPRSIVQREESFNLFELVLWQGPPMEWKFIPKVRTGWSQLNLWSPYLDLVRLTVGPWKWLTWFLRPIVDHTQNLEFNPGLDGKPVKFPSTGVTFVSRAKWSSYMHFMAGT
jgi:hypothetical protein